MIMGLNFLSTLIKKRVNNARKGSGLCINCLAPSDGHGLCDPCRMDLPLNHWHCRHCALPLPFVADTRACGECLRSPPPFTTTIAPWRYQFPVDRMIGRYKYRGQRAFARPLISGLCQQVSEQLQDRPLPDLIIPAPMDRRRQRQRGFNQAEDIAEQISHHTGIPLGRRVVRRTRQVATQRGLDRAQRLANLRGVFQVTAPVPGSVAIVDDVITTGATARAMTLVLREAGAEEVQVWALARTP